MVSSLSRDRNFQIKGSGAALIVVEEVDSRIRFDVIDLNEKDDNDIIPLREILTRFRTFYVVAPCLTLSLFPLLSLG